MYEQFDLEYNFYKDVNDFKFNFKYRSLADYFKTRRYVLDRIALSKGTWYKEYFLHERGLKAEPFEEYAKLRQKQRTGNWEILT